MSLLALSGLAAIALLAAATPPQSVETAIEKQRALVASHPNDSAAQNDLGNLLRMSGQLAAAEEAYRAAIAADPVKTVPRYNLALLLQQQSQSRAALRELEGVVEIDAGHAWAHYQIGAIKESRGDDEGALASYARAFALKPDLASDKVNPQVIESKLSTRAMLVANSNRAALTQAGSSYEDPARIAVLLVPPLPSSASATEPGSEAATAPAVTPSPTPAPRSSKTTEPAASSARVLDQQSLDEDRPTGQVRPSAGSAPSGNRSGGVRSTGANRTWQQSATGGSSSAPRTQAGRPTAVGQPRVATPTVSQPGTPGAKQTQPGYRPGTASTAWPQNRIYQPEPLPPNE